MSASIPWSSNFRSTVYDYSSSDDDVSDTEGSGRPHRQSTVTTYADAGIPGSESIYQTECEETAVRVTSKGADLTDEVHS